ncbi:hypothetical protein K2173_018336 [Erythroxylum novogranatense]|uniref:SET domain-containing protein n=1 Tax=Erythroxylum novogranatense TaxID=1862640 RepID=A0AAV8UDQ4_9ROSI|nr:hypothetical protein K2173_018336 [Erythroxylum novogranatense]
MPPRNPRILKALHAMKALGISEAKVKPVLKKLYKLYDKNWDLIEQENYRALADAIFEEEDAKVPEEPHADDDLEEEAEVHNETQQPLKRLRKRGQEMQICSSPSNPEIGGTPLKIPKLEKNNLPGADSMQMSPNIRKSESFPSSASAQDHTKIPDKQHLALIPSAVQGSTNSAQLGAADRTMPSNPLSPQRQQANKGKEPLIPQAVCKEKRPISIRSSHGVHIKDTAAESGTPLPCAKEKDMLFLITPKDEPITDDMPLSGVARYDVPCAVVQSASSSKGDSVVQDAMIREPRACNLVTRDVSRDDVPSSSSEGRDVRRDDVPASSSEGRDARRDGILASSSDRVVNCDLAAMSGDSPTSLEIATSPLGEVKISLTCDSLLRRPNFHMPSQDELLKTVQEKCLRSYKIVDPNFSVMRILKDMCECFLELATDSSHESQERLFNVTPALDLLKKSTAHSSLHAPGFKEHNGLADVNRYPGGSKFPVLMPLQTLCPMKATPSSKEVTVNGIGEIDEGKDLIDHQMNSLVIVPQCQLTPEDFRSLYTFSDITKGEEKIQIPWLNEINNECPLPFYYIPQNLIFQNACVRFSLSQIRTEECCSTCSGDCLISPSPCVCAGETGQYAYTPEGLVKEDFLEECISMTRNPQQQSLFYCEDCPLERWKNEEMMELCKGHLKRKYIKECWFKCGCHKQCGNRVVQRGTNCKLQVFFTPEGKGWGVRTLEKLPKGTFVCEYVGEILTSKELYERKMQMVKNTATELHTYPVILDSYWWLKGVMKDEEALCLDSKFHGNVARFINHRCLDANLIEIPVKIETPDHHYYHIAFFTTREVDAWEELTWDYGIDFDDNDQPVEIFQCQCSSKFCRNMRRSNRPKSASK